MVSATQPQLVHRLGLDSRCNTSNAVLSDEAAWCESRAMTKTAETLRSIARPGPPEPTAAAAVIAIVRLRGSGRSWFVTAVHQRQSAMEIVGYAPGCMHSPGRWFSLQPDFFEIAATASGDQLEVELLKRPVPLEMLEDESL